MFVLRSTHMAMLRSHDRQRQHWEGLERELLDRIMYLTDRPWGLPQREGVPETTVGLSHERFYLDGQNEVSDE